AMVPHAAGARDPVTEAAGGASSAAGRFVVPERVARAASRIGVTLLSVGLFCAIWELLWLTGVSDPKLLPPPHVFLGNFPEQAKFFNTAQRWQIGVGMNTGPSPEMAVLITMLSSGGRVIAGLMIAAVLSIT